MRFFPSLLILSLAVVLLSSCETEHPCKVHLGEPATSAFKTVETALPLQGKDKVCGMKKGALYVGHKDRGNYKEIAELYRKHLEEQGYKNVTKSWDNKSNVGVFTVGDESWSISSWDRHDWGVLVKIESRTKSYREKLSWIATPKKIEADKKARAAMAERIQQWLPEPEALSKLSGTQACPANTALPASVWTEKQLEKWRAEPYPRLICTHFGEFGKNYGLDNLQNGGGWPRKLLLKDDCKTFMADVSPLAILWTDSSATHAPSSVKLAQNTQGRSSFKPGKFTGRVVIWSRKEQKPLCWAPVNAINSARINMEVTTTMDGKIIKGDNSGPEMRDFHRQIHASTRRAVQKIGLTLP